MSILHLWIGRATGAKLSLSELVQKVRDERLYEQMPPEEIDRLIENLEAEKLSHKQGKRLTAPQKVADVAQTLKRVGNEVCILLFLMLKVLNICMKLLELHGWCGIHAMLFAVRSEMSFKMDPYCFFTDEDSQFYLSGVRKIDVQDFATCYESWAISKLPGKYHFCDCYMVIICLLGIIDSSRERVNSLKEQIRQMINKGLGMYMLFKSAHCTY